MLLQMCWLSQISALTLPSTRDLGLISHVGTLKLQLKELVDTAQRGWELVDRIMIEQEVEKLIGREEVVWNKLVPYTASTVRRTDRETAKRTDQVAVCGPALRRVLETEFTIVLGDTRKARPGHKRRKLTKAMLWRAIQRMCRQENSEDPRLFEAVLKMQTALSVEPTEDGERRKAGDANDDEMDEKEDEVGPDDDRPRRAVAFDVALDLDHRHSRHGSDGIDRRCTSTSTCSTVWANLGNPTFIGYGAMTARSTREPRTDHAPMHLRLRGRTND
jgi:hypothetical protein